MCFREEPFAHRCPFGGSVSPVKFGVEGLFLTHHFAFKVFCLKPFHGAPHWIQSKILISFVTCRTQHDLEGPALPASCLCCFPGHVLVPQHVPDARPCCFPVFLSARSSRRPSRPAHPHSGPAPRFSPFVALAVVSDCSYSFVITFS